MRHRLAMLLLGGALLLSACGGTGGQPNQASTVYDLIAYPEAFNGQQVTVLGHYLWKPGNPGISLLLPGVSVSDLGTDAQPIGEPVWLEGFPAALTADLHRPSDAVYGVVEVTGKFEFGQGFGAQGAYNKLLTVSEARVSEQIERLRVTVPDEVPEGVTSLKQLLADPGRFHGQRVTTRGYYFWSPPTAGLLAEGVEAEKFEGSPDPKLAKAGLNPAPVGLKLALDGFPPELSGQLNLGTGNSFVWGLVEVTGLFETGGAWGVDGSLQQHFQIESVKVLEPQP